MCLRFFANANGVRSWNDRCEIKDSVWTGNSASHVLFVFRCKLDLNTFGPIVLAKHFNAAGDSKTLNKRIHLNSPWHKIAVYCNNYLEHEVHVCAQTACVGFAIERNVNLFRLKTPTWRWRYFQDVIALIIDGQEIISIRW